MTSRPDWYVETTSEERNSVSSAGNEAVWMLRNEAAGEGAGGAAVGGETRTRCAGGRANTSRALSAVSAVSDATDSSSFAFRCDFSLLGGVRVWRAWGRGAV